jgi:hypothetical protein
LANGVAAVAPLGNIEWRDEDKIRKVIAEEISAKVSADKAYQNAMKNSGKENARIEHNKALEKAVIELLSRNTPVAITSAESAIEPPGLLGSSEQITTGASRTSSGR